MDKDSRFTIGCSWQKNRTASLRGARKGRGTTDSLQTPAPRKLSSVQGVDLVITPQWSVSRICPPELKVRTPAHTKHLGWYNEFEFQVTHGNPMDSWWGCIGWVSGSALWQRRRVFVAPGR